MELKSLSGNVCVNRYKLHVTVSKGLKSFKKDSMLIYCTRDTVALGPVIQAFNEDEHKENGPDS